ncbi:integral membrane protein [Colletotrichum simmondsii]|uniref:Integral membrane protein n=1 Tax=Colletotrichum simmondsii TaxID=703756 RepID=A0A135RPE4_9PEZI|nr:integral membrane protein [Colletotrichum simmondsii]
MKNHVRWFLALLPWVAGTVLGQDSTNTATSPLELMSQIPQCAAILATTLGCVVATADLGFGLHYWNVNPENAQTILQLYYAVQMLYIVVLILAKLSIIALFARVFPDRKFQIINKLVFVFLAGHGLVFLFVIMFECTPIAGIWDRTIERKCLGDNVDVVTWSMTEISCALMCGSLPALRPLLKKIPGLLTTIRGTRPTVEAKETLNRASSRLSFGDKKPVAPAPVITSRHRSVPSPEPSPSEDSFMIKVHISEHLDPRMKPLPPAPLQPLSYQPPWRDSATLQAPRTPMTPMSIRSFRREANAEYELDLRGVVNTKTWM